MTREDLESELRELEQKFEQQGGRGVELAERIDQLRRMLGLGDYMDDDTEDEEDLLDGHNIDPGNIGECGDDPFLD